MPPTENRPRAKPHLPLFILPFCLAGCSGSQSALSPAGEEASSIYLLLIVTTCGAAVIWCLVTALLVYAGRSRRHVYSAGSGQKLILWGGAILPASILCLLLGYALWLMPATRPWLTNNETSGFRIEATGEQYWWRFAYRDADNKVSFETANELRLPVGERVRFALRAADVIHSFWIPSLGGKMDMIPGRTNFFSLEATRPGIYRAPCAEFCGTSHALMAFTVVVMEKEPFREWMERQTNLLRPRETEGARLFARHGCAACHTIRGTQARGRIGPDLTDIGARQTIAAGTLANTAENIARFIRAPHAVKPGVKMPAFPMIPQAELTALAAYLKGLQ
jgi:cytochrome c oxidase subunit 2